ncbi:MAG: hypothetical protein ACI9ES_003532 [Oceanospirillaceae bacterium]|jgi:hypothetical protein
MLNWKLLRHVIIIPLISLVLSGCQLIRVEQASFSPSSPIRYNEKAEHIFNPLGKELFVLKDKANGLQERGFNRFCQNTKNIYCKNRLPYNRFVGMKGYFDKKKPIKTDHKSFAFYPVVLENGNRYFFVSLQKEGGKYGKTSPIRSVSLDQHYLEKPLIKNSTITVIGEYSSFGKDFYQLNNGNTVEKIQLEYIRAISAKYPNQAEVGELLLGTFIERNELYKSYLIYPKASTKKTYGEQSNIKLLIGINDQHQWLRFKVSHLGNKNLNIKSFSVIADEMIWRSPNLQFETTRVAQKYEQSFEITANNQELDLINAMSVASKAMLKLHGSEKSVSQILKGHQKQQLFDITNLYQLLAKH